VSAEIGQGKDVTIVADDLSGANDTGTVSANIADISTVAGIDGEVSNVSINASVVDTVGSDLAGGSFHHDLGSITNPAQAQTNVPDGYIISVYNIRGDVQTVSGISGAVSSVAAVDADVSTVASIDSDVTLVASRESDITSVAGFVGAGNDITVVAADIPDINTVAGISADVSSVSAISADVSTVAGISAGVTTLNNNEANVNTVAGSITDVQSVAAVDTDVSIVSSVSSDVSTVSGISSDVTTVAANVSDVTNFADVYIGPASSDPSTRSDGSSLQNGDLYFNTTDDRLKIYDGAQWEITARDDSDIKSLLSASGDLFYDSATGEFSFTERTDVEVRALLSASGDLSYNTTTGEFSVTTYKSSDFDTDFSAKSTSDLTEGTNLYYTDARVNADIDDRVDRTFVNALNVDSDTLDGQEGTYYLDRANHTGTQALSTISDSGALAALDEVDTAQIANQAVTDDKLATTLDLGSI